MDELTVSDDVICNWCDSVVDAATAHVRTQPSIEVLCGECYQRARAEAAEDRAAELEAALAAAERERDDAYIDAGLNESNRVAAWQRVAELEAALRDATGYSDEPDSADEAPAAGE